MTQNTKQICPDCGNGFLITDAARGETICTSCGAVIEQKIIDSGAEWRAFTPQDYKNRTRVGSKSRLDQFDKGLTTIIPKENKDAYGIPISPNMRDNIYRLRKWHERTKRTKPKDRNLNDAMNELDHIGSQLNLSKDIKESSAFIYRKALSKGITKGRSIIGIISASTFIACRLNRIPITFESFTEITSLKKRIIAKFVRAIKYELNIRLPTSSPKDYISYYASELKLSGEVQSLAIKIIELAQKKGMMKGKSPSGFGAGALYKACRILGETRSQKEISVISNVTEVTLRNRYKEISSILKNEEGLYNNPSSTL